MPQVYIPRAEYVRRFGEAAYRACCAARSAKKKRTRARARLRRLGDDAPMDPVLRRNVMNAHPEGCVCWDCLWGHPDDRPGCRLAKWPERIRL